MKFVRCTDRTLLFCLSFVHFFFPYTFFCKNFGYPGKTSKVFGVLSYFPTSLLFFSNFPPISRLSVDDSFELNTIILFSLIFRRFPGKVLKIKKFSTL